MESLSLLLLTTITLAARLYRAQASSHEKAAEEEQRRKSCQAQAAEQANSHRAQIRALQAQSESEKRANGALRYEKSAVEDRLTALIAKSDRCQRDSEYQRRAGQALRDQMKAAQESTTDVQNARRIIAQWDSFSDTLKKVGFVAKTPTDLGRSIEKLLELRDSATASSNQAALNKRELASEKAAKEAALEKVTNLQRNARILEIEIANLKETAKKRLPNRQSSAISSAEFRATVQREVDQRMAKERAEMIKDLQGQYIKKQEAVIKELQEDFSRAVATEVNSELNKHCCEKVDKEAAAKAVTEIESCKTHATELGKQLQKAHEATAEADSKLHKAEDAVRQNDDAIAALNKQKNAEITALDAKLQKMIMTGATASTSLQQELSQTKIELATANNKIKNFETEKHGLLEEGRTLEGNHSALRAEYDVLAQTSREHEDNAKRLTQQVTEFPKVLANAEKEIANRDEQVNRLTGELAIANSGVAKRDGEVIRLTGELAIANQGVANRDVEVARLTNELAIANQGIANHNGQDNELSTKFANANHVIANRDKLITRLTSELETANQGITERDELVKNLSSQIIDAGQQLLNNWDAANPDFVNSNYNSEQYNIDNSVANGLYFDPQSSSIDPSLLGNGMTNQGTSFDPITGGLQAGTEFSLEDFPLYYGLNNNGNFGDNTDFGAPNAPNGLNNGDSSNNTDLEAYIDYNSLANGHINNFADSGALNGVSGSNNNGNFSDSLDLSALNGVSGSNNNGDLSNIPDLGTLNNYDESNMNMDGNASNIPDLRAQNDMSGSNNNGDFQPQ